MVDKNLRFARFMNVTILHDEPTKAARFVRDVFKAHEVDQDLCFKIATLVPNENNECERVTSGGLTYQFMKPSAALPGSMEFYEKEGSRLYSYTLAVKSVSDAVDQLCKTGGAKLVAHLTGDDRIPYNSLFEGEGDPIEYAVVDAREKCGLLFELISQDLPVPCYTDVRFPEDLGVFQHAEITVKDPKKSADWLCEIMGGERVESEIAARIGSGNANTGDGIPDMSEYGFKSDFDRFACDHVLVAGYVFQLITPMPHLPGWDDNLATHGNSINNICYHLYPRKCSVPQMTEAMEARGAKELMLDENDEHGECWEFTFGPLYGEDNDDFERTVNCVWIDSMKQCGLNWEFIGMVYRWNTNTGYFFHTVDGDH